MSVVGWSELSLSSIYWQVIFDPSNSVGTLTSTDADAIFTSSLIYPLYVTAASILVLLLHVIGNTPPVRKLFRRPNVSVEEPPAHAQSESFVQEIKLHIREHGGAVIYAYMVARLIGTLALLGLSIVTLVLDEFKRVGRQEDVVTFGKWGKKYPNKKYGTRFSNREWLEAGLCLTFLYASLLALMSVTAKPRWSRVVIWHLNMVLLATLCVYLYRDIYPLATFFLDPKDLSEGTILWNPLPEPNPEQTASIFSFITFAFLDSLVYAANRVTHLGFEKLPPLNDRDFAEHLKELSFKHLDLFSGAPKRHLFFGLMRVFRGEYLVLVLMILLYALAEFAAPIGLNRLLRYLESGGKDAMVRPWVWILWLFLGPVGATLAFQVYIFISTRSLVRTQAIITQLVFEHSLRIRVKAETSDPNGTSTFSSPGTLTPDSASAMHEGTIDGSDTLHSVVRTEIEPSALHSSSSSVSSSKRKNQKDEQKNEDHSLKSDASNLVGRINNLVTTDLENITEGRDFLFLVLYIPVQIGLCIVFLYLLLGWSSFVGMGVIIMSLPLPGYISKWVQNVQEKRMKMTDARVQTVSESMNVLRMIKLFGWESRMDARVGEKRDEELIWIRRYQLLDVLNEVISYAIPVLTMIATIAMKQTMQASIIFSSMTVFDMLSRQMRIVFQTINETITAKVSLDRVTDFLQNTELLDSFSEKIPESGYFVPADQVTDSQEIGFRNATFAWSSDVAGSFTPSKCKFKLKIEGELLFRKNCVNLIIGQTGSGKTSLLMALLSEMHFIPSGPDSWYNLPRNEGIAYAAQESWVQNETIRANIVFGSPFDEERYKKVIYQCGLERDITLFEAGDATEVGEKGLTLSGGQKARITLARAIYSYAKVIFVHTSKWIVDKCFTGDLMEGRTMILVTHNIAIIDLSPGRIESQGTVSEALGKDPVLAEEARIEQQVIDKAHDFIDYVTGINCSGALALFGPLAMEPVTWQPKCQSATAEIKLHIREHGGAVIYAYMVARLIGTLALLGLSIVTLVLDEFKRVGRQEDVVNLREMGKEISEQEIRYTFSNREWLELGFCLTFVVFSPYFSSVYNSSSICSFMLAPCAHVVTAKPRWSQSGYMAFNMVTSGDLVVYLYPGYLPSSDIFSPDPKDLSEGTILWVKNCYLDNHCYGGPLAVPRRYVPVDPNFGAAITGITSIRAYGVQEAFTVDSLRRIDKYTRAARIYFNLNRWISVRIDILGSLLAAGLAVYLVYFRGHTASDTGFSLNMTVGFSSLIVWWVRSLNEFEVQGGLERIQGYINIEQEPKSNIEGVPPAYWPASGELRVEGLSARYSLDGPKVLHDISFSIKSGERVGVVGRTGSGKSSLTLSLLRCIFTEGKVYYDGVPTDKINLDALRTSITIIPQVPELLSGTLRQNLDPFDQYDDAALNDALRAAGLFALQNEMDRSGGSNLSVGQRQILALARALVRGSKLLILDEDYKTDSIIQDSLRNELKGDITLITVAHRLQTIMDADKIMVLDAGRIVEFDSPEALLKIKDGKLRSLVDESNDKDVLYAMAEKAHTTS
ncbi:hypothetical protein BT96DRAFT_960666 [Gymnopus androsaceus JB14]|uniref:P-loop containing nucleoside triphosphate hydrolase protein n=1 Tax=Gymnopus androsaceus JB14 TaxID=1447944 RepID=A0A6A4GKP8_9AGAR|nr:hypothetical protein BT96DRAFT_960666 [Gymnopus androsaceus JB14]